MSASQTATSSASSRGCPPGATSSFARVCRLRRGHLRAHPPELLGAVFGLRVEDDELGLLVVRRLVVGHVVVVLVLILFVVFFILVFVVSVVLFVVGLELGRV